MSKTCSSAISAPSSLSHSASSIFGKPETASVAQDINTRVQHLLAGFAQRGITVTEWGTLLYCRYNVPLTIIDFSFLVDDNLLEDACRLAKELGLRPAESKPILIHVHGEYETRAHHFSWSGQRVNLYPASFASFRTEELYSAPFCLSHTCPPVSVLIPRVAPLVACLVRLISQVRFDDPMCLLLKADLSSLIAYTLFNMEYEGDYMTFDQAQDEIEQNTEAALVLYRRWDGWRDDEIWIADAVEWLIRGKGSYDSLPVTERARSMTTQIQITLDRDLQLFAAIELSEALTKMALRHAFIGGFALAALGSTRRTTDIDIMIDIEPGQILEYLRPQLAVRNHHFAESGLKFYFCPDLTSNRKGAELVRANTKNVLIETISSRSLGLPPHLDPEMLFKNHELPILHPSVLILTKIKRWTRINMSTYPPNLRRAPNDLLDIAFLAKLLDENGSKISFQLYHAQYPEVLDQAVKDAVTFLQSKGLVAQSALLINIIAPSDRERLGI